MAALYDFELYSTRSALLSDQNEVLSYDQLVTKCEALEKHLVPRTLTFVFCKNINSSAIGYLSCLRKKSVAVLLDNQIHISLFKGLFESYRPYYLYFPNERTDLASFGTSLFGDDHYTLLKTELDTRYEIHPDVAVLMTTSGSTGSPKFVMQSYRNLNSNAESICHYLNIQSSDRAITTMPMSYVYGLSVINSHLLAGASIVLTELSMMQRSFWDLIRSAKVNNFGGVPYSYQFLKKLNFKEMNLPNLRYITQAGGKLDPALTREIAESCREKGIQFFTMYGQTEATARMSYLHSDLVHSRAGSIGKAIPGGEFWLEDDAGRRIEEPDTVGELVYSGPNVSFGYAESWRDLAKGDINKGVLKTGDLAQRSEDGFYSIAGRTNRFAKVFGNRVNLDEVEGVARNLGFECGCLGTDDKLEIYVTSNPASLDIKRELSQTMRIHPSAFKVIQIDEIPRNSSGKVLYGKLQEACENV